MISIVTAAFLSIVTGVAVAVVSHLLTNKRNRKNELESMRLKAYTDFVNAATRLATARRMGKTEDELEELAALNDAKVRVCICGDEQVVEKLVEFWNTGATLELESGILAFTRLCYVIRESLGHPSKLWSRTRLTDTIFKLEPSNYSYLKGNKNKESQDINGAGDK